MFFRGIRKKKVSISIGLIFICACMIFSACALEQKEVQVKESLEEITTAKPSSEKELSLLAEQETKPPVKIEIDPSTEIIEEQGTEETSAPLLTTEYELIYEGISLFNCAGQETYFKYDDSNADLYMRHIQDREEDCVELSLWVDEKEVWHTIDSELVYEESVFWREDSENLTTEQRQCYYVIPIDEGVYLMQYRIEEKLGEITMSYKIFGIDTVTNSYEGNEVLFDADSISVYTVCNSDVDRSISFPIEEILSFAGTLGNYMENGYLVASTLHNTFEFHNDTNKENPNLPYLYDIFPWVVELTTKCNIDIDDIHSEKELLGELQKALPKEDLVTMPAVSADGKSFIVGNYYGDEDADVLTVHMNEDGSYGGQLLIDNLLNIEYVGYYDNKILKAVEVGDYWYDTPYKMDISFSGTKATVTLKEASEEGYAKVGDAFIVDRSEKPVEFEYLKFPWVFSH